MRHLTVLLGIAGLLLVAVGASGDVVYTTDGRKLEGKVTEGGDEVTLITNDGSTLAISRDDIIHILTLADTPDPNPLDEGLIEPDETLPENPDTEDIQAENVLTGDTDIDTDAIDGPESIDPPQTLFGLNTIVQPESVVFLYMRRLSDETSPMEIDALQEAIEKWQAASHDKHRKVSSGWSAPNEFTASRTRYTSLLDKVADASKELKNAERDLEHEKDETLKAKKSRLLNAAKKDYADNITAAAGAWRDPTMRQFLTGIAYYKTEEYRNAMVQFDRCRKTAPLVAAYHQGYGLAAMHVPGKELDAIDAMLDEYSLDPDDIECAKRLQIAMDNVPGDETKDPIFERARAVIKNCKTSSLRSNAKPLVWQMPGDNGWLDKGINLPIPPYDRLAFRQSTGVAISETMVMVDAATVEGASKVFIRAGDIMVPATIKKASSSDIAVAPEVTWIETTEMTFTDPVTVDRTIAFELDDRATFQSLGMFIEMGTAPRTNSTRITEIADTGEVTKLKGMLQPGETATPILTDQGELIGVLAPKIDYLSEDGGEDTIISVQTLAPMIERRKKSTPATPSTRLRLFVEPTEIEDPVVTVYAIETESLE